ncbi:MAG: hypothetical protein PWP27_1833 [Clostridiales bacterium]|jgi:hypothetical protein|nr:hypothetical protein [Clostridiales bacterium]MDK2934023.1 hypothetical protein [Clostridiales bacterium]
MRKLFFLILIGIMLITGPLNPVMVHASSEFQFSDVKKTDWFYPTVSKLVEKGYIGGYPDGTFKPQNNIRVSEFTKILISAIGYQVDVSKGGYWAEGYINKAKELGIIKDGEFGDYDRYITRGEMARMIVRAGTDSSIKEQGISLDVPENYKEYSSLITDYSTLDPNSQDIALKIFTSGIISGFPDGSFGFNKNATRAEACAILIRFLEKEQRKIPILPEKVDFSNTLTVKEFTEMVLKAVGREATMEYAQSKEFVRPSADYPSYEKPILRREAALTVARIMDDITGMPALFTSGKNDYFLKGYTENHRIQPYQINTLINDIGLKNNSYEKYFTLIYWHDYIGNIKDIRMITEEYLKEMMTLYLAGLLDTDEDGKLRPYDFLTKEEAKELVDRLKRYDLKDSKKIIEQLPMYVRDLDAKPMENFLKSTNTKILYKRILDEVPIFGPEIEKPSNKELWWTTYAYVNKRLYEYPLETDYDFISNSELKTRKYERPLNEIDNAFIHLNDFDNYARTAKNYMNVRYNVDYRNLDAEAPYYSPLVANKGMKKEVGDYKTRVLFYFNPQHVLNGIEDEDGNRKDESTWILPDDFINQEIEKYKKYKIVSQAEFITHDSLVYWENGSGHIRGTLRIIYYPPTDPNYLRDKGLEVGKWYEKDIEVLFTNAVLSGNASKYGNRWAHSLLFYMGLKDLNSMSYIKLKDLLDFKNFRLLEELDFRK